MTTPASSAPPVYLFADLTLDAGQRRVLRRGSTIDLNALGFDLLRVLVESAPNIVTSEVLAEKVWGRHFVSPENVAQRVMLLRQALGDDASQPRYIETVRNKGYRLIPLARIATPPPSVVRRGQLFLAAGGLVLASGLAIGIYRWVASPTEATDALAARVPPRNSVAVLPFENLSPDPDDAYFAVGIYEAIQNQLTEIGSLHIAPRTSARSYVGTQKSVPEIARELNVEYVLDGSVRYADGSVVVTVYLNSAATNKTLWSDDYPFEFSDIFANQSKIAIEVADALQAKLLPAERERIERVPTKDPRAYAQYLSATARGGTESLDQFRLAIKEIDDALRLDPEFALAWVRKAALHLVAQFLDPQNAAEHFRLGEDAARRALRIDPALGPAHGALAFALFLKNDWAGGEVEYREALRLKVPLGEIPDYAVLQRIVGNFVYAREIMEETRATIDNPIAVLFLILDNALLGDWAAVDAQYEAGKSLYVDWPRGDRLMMHLWVARGELERARAIPAADPINAKMLANADAPHIALRELHALYDATSSGDPSRRIDVALWAGHFGDTSFALRAMRAAITEQVGLAQYLWLPQLREMRRLPEFKALLREIGIVAYWQEYGWQAVCQPLHDGDFECD